MNYEIRNRPSYASLHVKLDAGERFVTEPGAMMSMTGDLALKSNMRGGLLASAKRLLGGESLVLNTYTAQASAQQLDLAPGAPGDVRHLAIEDRAIMVQSGSYFASSPEVELDTKWGGAKTFFGGEGLFMLKASGSGDLFVSSYGAIHEVIVQGSYTVDTSHIVAFDDALQFDVRKVGGLKSLFLSGEGLVCEFRGHGRLWIQTRDASSLVAFLHAFRPVKSSSSSDD